MQGILRRISLEKYFWLILFVLILGSGALNAQVQAVSQGDFVAEIMKSTFSSLNDPGKTYVEVYLTLLPAQYNYSMKEDNNYYAFIRLDMEIKDNQETVVDRQSWQRVLTAANLESIQGQAIVDMANFMLVPGNYTVNLTIQDLSTRNATNVPPEILHVPRYNSSILSLSDIDKVHQIIRG